MNEPIDDIPEPPTEEPEDPEPDLYSYDGSIRRGMELSDAAMRAADERHDRDR